jgi:hypothetical protein
MEPLFLLFLIYDCILAVGLGLATVGINIICTKWDATM